MKAILENLRRDGRRRFGGFLTVAAIVVLLPVMIGTAARCAGDSAARNIPASIQGGCRLGLNTSNPTASCTPDGVCLVCYDTFNNSECRAVLMEWCK